MISEVLPTSQRALPLVLSLILLLSESGAPAARIPGAATTFAAASLNARIDACVKAVARGEYTASIPRAQLLLGETLQQSRPDLEGRIRLALGGALLGTAQYRTALQILLPARKLALQSRNQMRLYAIDNDIAWIYLKMERLGVAAEFADEALAAIHSLGKDDARLIILRALVFAKQHDFNQSTTLFLQAINRCLDTGDLVDAATAWDYMGRGYAGTAHRAEAEFALTEAFRLRSLHHLPELEVSMRDLAEPVAGRGDLKTSSVLVDEAVARSGDPRSTADQWGFLLSRGKVRMLRGDLASAFSDFRAALSLARRLDVIPTDDDRVTFESGLAELYSLFIDCGNRLYLQTRDPRLKEETFEAAEENRAASLRALVPQPHDWRKNLPPEHGEVLAQLQEAERSLLINPDSQTAGYARTLQARLDEIESQAESSGDLRPVSARQAATEAADGDTAVLSFHLGSSGSWVWFLQGNQFEVSPLPNGPGLARDAERFRDLIADEDAARRIGDSIGVGLLSVLPPEVHRKHRWIVALDGELLDIPLGAVRWNGRYLVENHALLVTPGIRLLKAAGSEKGFSGELAAIGDPIYNRADSRWKGQLTWESARQTLGFGAPDHWHLARLAGTGPEVRSAVEYWGSGHAWTGPAATKANYLQAATGNPVIIHLATHVIRAARDDRAGMIVFGLNGQAEPEFLGAREILLRPSSARLVVMSGCASGDGKALPANGLMGLTRAWLGSGVDDVLATRWASIDDNGPFFASFYRALKEHPKGDAAEALRMAQVEMIKSHSFRNHPEYWASYFLIGKV